MARGHNLQPAVGGPERSRQRTASGVGSVQSMGRKLELRKATVDQFIVQHVEKTPGENEQGSVKGSKPPGRPEKSRP